MQALAMITLLMATTADALALPWPCRARGGVGLEGARSEGQPSLECRAAGGGWHAGRGGGCHG